MRRLTKLERRYIQLGADGCGESAAILYRKRILRLVANMIAGHYMLDEEYSEAKMRLVEAYRLLSKWRSPHDVRRYEELYLELEEIRGLLEDGAEPRVIVEMLEEINKDLRKRASLRAAP